MALVGLAALSHGTPRPVEIAPTHRAHAIRAEGPLDVNRATASELATLPRVGPTLADRIVADRTARGPYPSLDALDRVPGIGPATIRGIRPHAVALPAPASRQ